MRTKACCQAFLIVMGVAGLAPATGAEKATTRPAESLEVAFDDKGLSSVCFGGHQFHLSAAPRIYTFNCIEDGKKTRPEYHWMTRSDRRFDPATRTLTAKTAWGEYRMVYSSTASRLRMRLTAENKTDKTFTDMTFWLAKISFPKRPTGFNGYRWKQGWHIQGGGQAPAALIGDYGSGAVVYCIDRSEPGVKLAYGPHKDKLDCRLIVTLAQLEPGKTGTVDLSLRFGPGSSAGGTPPDLAKDVFAAFAKGHPLIVRWPDRRPIATLHPSSSHLGAGTVKIETPNPRGWIGGTAENPIDVTTEAGREAFKTRMMAFAGRSVGIIKEMNGQGMICWSLEGQQYPHTISYVGSPDRLAELAPEMDAIADEWFKVFSDAGLRTGICLRPQELTKNPKGFANKSPFMWNQRNLWDAEGDMDAKRITELLAGKIRYARTRWGCTLYYVDTNVGSKYAKDAKTGKWRSTYRKLHPYKIYAELTRRFPDCMIIPEHEDLLYWSGSVPLGATPPLADALWPDAFSVNLMQNFKHEDPTVVTHLEHLVRRGDILLFPGWYRAKSNEVVKGIYRRHVPKWHGEKPSGTVPNP